MKPLVLALGIVLTGVILTFTLLNLLTVPKELAGSASSVFLGAIPYVHKQVDKRSKLPIPAFSKKQIVPLEDFVLPGYVILAYGILLGFAATQGIGALGGLIGGITAALVEGGATSSGAATLITMAVITPFQWFAIYLVGRWIGVRSRSGGIWLAVVVFTAVVSIEHGLRLILPWTTEILGRSTPIEVVLQWGLGLIIWTALGLAGFWRGRRIQSRRYADYLLRKVCLETRHVILGLLRDEIAAVAAKRTPEVGRAPTAAAMSTPVTGTSPA